jgi:hypothetical protein
MALISDFYFLHVQVVSEKSATYPPKSSVSCDCTHRELHKFSSPNDEGYQNILRWVNTMIMLHPRNRTEQESRT